MRRGDEPLSALDASIREYLRGELARLHTEGDNVHLSFGDAALRCL